MTQEETMQKKRLFLVVVDNSEEWRAAMLFACHRARYTGGAVALLHVIEPADFQHWMAVEQALRIENREKAEALLEEVATEVQARSGQPAIYYIREGVMSEEVLNLIAEDSQITALVLAASPGNEGPGPLIQDLLTNKITQLPVPITIIPGQLNEEQIKKL